MPALTKCSICDEFGARLAPSTPTEKVNHVRFDDVFRKLFRINEWQQRSGSDARSQARVRDRSRRGARTGRPDLCRDDEGHHDRPDLRLTRGDAGNPCEGLQRLHGYGREVRDQALTRAPDQRHQASPRDRG